MVSSSLSDWLPMREAADAAARSGDLTCLIANALKEYDPVRVLDLATGTGANVRYLAPHIPPPQHWLAVDRDPALLAVLPEVTVAWAAARTDDVRPQVDTRQVDLESLSSLDIFAGRHLVTASALLDLVSGRWLEELVERCRREGAAALFTISYDGRSCCSPREPEDDLIREFMNEHQRRDKGLGGIALGPGGAAYAIQCFTAAGYRVDVAPSDWELGPEEAAMQRALIEGWAHAAAEMGLESTTIASWLSRRFAHIEAGRSRIVVGHLDVAALPPRT